jgi:flagellar motility protein MotE (MotC chaperone)
MGLRDRFFASPFLAILVLSVLLMKALLAAQVLISRDDSAAPFAVPEALAKDQKKTAPPPAQKDPADKPQPQPDVTKTSPLPPPNPVDTAVHLQQKEAELKRMEQQLREQEQYLQQMQKDIEQKLQELIAIQKEIQTYRTERAESRSASIRSLAQIYGSMKPKEAAKLFGDMDEKLVVSVISTMKPNEAAEILSAMDTKKAAKVSEALTRR